MFLCVDNHINNYIEYSNWLPECQIFLKYCKNLFMHVYNFNHICYIVIIQLAIMSLAFDWPSGSRAYTVMAFPCSQRLIGRSPATSSLSIRKRTKRFSH